MLNHPWDDGICLGFLGDREWPRYIIKREKPGQAVMYWTGKEWVPGAKRALLYNDFEKCRDDAWDLKKDWLHRQ